MSIEPFVEDQYSEQSNLNNMDLTFRILFRFFSIKRRTWRLYFYLTFNAGYFGLGVKKSFYLVFLELNIV